MEQNPSAVNDLTLIQSVLGTMKVDLRPQAVTRFHAEEDGRPYQVWKLETDRESYVLKEASLEECAVYQAFLSDCAYAPKVYGSARYEDRHYLLMEYVSGESMSRCDRRKLTLTLDALIAGQEQYWSSTAHTEVGYSFDRAYASRRKRLDTMGDLSDVYSAYLAEFSTLPRTLCNDDMLPFNVLVGEKRAVIIDWEYAGILPYPCALARLLAFGEDDPDSLFQMTEADKSFALDYYYEKLLRNKGISREAYDRTMKLFFFHEYSDWLRADETSENYRKYAPKAIALATEVRKISVK